MKKKMKKQEPCKGEKKGGGKRKEGGREGGSTHTFIRWSTLASSCTLTDSLQ